VERLDGKGEWEAAVDTVGAGPGDRVLVITSYEATLPLRDQDPQLDVVGVDAAVVGIIDPSDRQEEEEL
jgi:microcompartment protein CcmK/EutM